MTYLLDPNGTLDYVFDWKALTHGTGTSDWLAAGESIVSYTITATTGVTVDSDSEDDGAVTVWLTDGDAGSNPKITCRITTDAGRTDDRTIRIRVTER